MDRYEYDAWKRDQAWAEQEDRRRPEMTPEQAAQYKDHAIRGYDMPDHHAIIVELATALEAAWAKIEYYQKTVWPSHKMERELAEARSSAQSCAVIEALKEALGDTSERLTALHGFNELDAARGPEMGCSVCFAISEARAALALVTG